MKPRYYQQDSHDAAWRYLGNEDGSPLIVLPTGAGKSLVIAMLVRQALEFDARVIVLQHRKELIQQNAEKIRLLLPDISVGVNSSGLRLHSFGHDVICGGIQTVYRKAHEFGRRELIIVDEAHLINDGKGDSMYSTFLKGIQELNNRARLVGLTATPFRTGQGPIAGSGKLFSGICYEAQTGGLIQEGYLCPITNRSAASSIDTSDIRKRGSEFINHEVEKAFDTDDNVGAACREIIEKCRDRHSILCFTSGIHHAESVAETLRNATGDRVDVVTGDTFPMERQKSLADFRNGSLRWLVNCDVLTTGFDAPCVDCVAVLRATMSPGLFAQIVGRGLRKHESKSDCLILDFGENIKRHGSLDDPEYGRASVTSSGTGEGAAVERNGRGKRCLNCQSDVPVNCRACPECGFFFPVKHESESDDASAIVGKAEPETWHVESVYWGLHRKRSAPDAPPTLRVNYVCQPTEGETGNLSRTTISEWVCIEHDGFAWTKAAAWWDARSLADMPTTVDEAILQLSRHVARMPSQITTQKEGRWQRIISAEFEDEKPEPNEWGPEVVAQEYSFASDEVPF